MMYHVHVRPMDDNKGHRLPVLSTNSYELAKKHAEGLLMLVSEGDLIEIAHGGLLVWGPYVKGGKFAP